MEIDFWAALKKPPQILHKFSMMDSYPEFTINIVSIKKYKFNQRSEKKMKKTLIIFTMVAALMATIGYSVLAFGPAAGRGPGQGGRMGMRNAGGNGLAAELKLTPEQQRKLLAIRQQFQKDTQDLRFEVQQKMLDLRELWSAKPLNQAALESKAKEVTALRVQLATKSQTMQDKMKAVLTPEQLKLFNERTPRGNGGFGGGRMKDGRGYGMNQAWGNCPALR
jgi:Spy/CpxP family protein refolding chaperone